MPPTKPATCQWRNVADDLKTSLLRIAMQAAIPLWIMEIQTAGGPQPDDYPRAQAISDDLGAHGDQLLFRSEKPGKTAQLFNDTAWAIALLSFCPGGITFCNDHYETVMRK